MLIDVAGLKHIKKGRRNTFKKGKTKRKRKKKKEKKGKETPDAKMRPSFKNGTLKNHNDTVNQCRTCYPKQIPTEAASAWVSPSPAPSPPHSHLGFPETDDTQYDNINGDHGITGSKNSYNPFLSQGYQHDRNLSPPISPLQQATDMKRPRLHVMPVTATKNCRRYYSSPLNDECQYTPVELYGLEQREPSIAERPKFLNRFSHALDDIREDLPLQLDPRNTTQKLRRRRESMLVSPTSPLDTASVRTGPSPTPLSQAAPAPMATFSNTNNTVSSDNRKDSPSPPRRGRFVGRLSILSLSSARKKSIRSQGITSISQPNLIGSSNDF